jgi:hypothetical protein
MDGHLAHQWPSLFRRHHVYPALLPIHRLPADGQDLHNNGQIEKCRPPGINSRWSAHGQAQGLIALDGVELGLGSTPEILFAYASRLIRVAVLDDPATVFELTHSYR